MSSELEQEMMNDIINAVVLIRGFMKEKNIKKIEDLDMCMICGEMKFECKCKKENQI